MEINYNPIADGSYVCSHRKILKNLGSWTQMTGEEKQFFNFCYGCKSYDEYIKSNGKITCPCLTCKHRKTEVQVDNQMTKLRRKYL